VQASELSEYVRLRAFYSKLLGCMIYLFTEKSGERHPRTSSL